jgi:putative FmdB family regulatory protein
MLADNSPALIPIIPSVLTSKTVNLTGFFMPIYEYCCQQCGHSLDILQKMSDAPVTLCPECKQHALTKLVSAAGFRLSGTGWYETDFKSDTDKKRNLSEPLSPKTEQTGATSEKTKTKTETSTATSSSNTSSTSTGTA